MKLLVRALALALLTSPAAPAAPPPLPAAAAVLRVTVETAGPTAAGREQACEVTFEGRHGGTSGQIAVDFGESQVRTRVGWWAPIPHRGAANTAFTLTPGGRLSEAYRLDLACSAHRRYRFEIAASDGAQRDEHTFYYPSEDGFTQETIIDLGALARHFEWIAPAADAEPQPVTLEGFSLDGEWVRYESTYDPNDGMRITVDRDKATITSVPESVHPAFREGSVIWRDIAGDGTLRTFGSDGAYYPARLTPEGADRLHVNISNSGPGNNQTWVRGASGAAVACSWTASGTSASADVWTTTSSALPSDLRDALRDVKQAGATIQTLALTPDDEWVVVADNVPCYSAGFPASVREHVDGYIASGREIDVVAFGEGGRWVILAEDWMRRAGVPETAANWARRLLDQGRRIDAFAFAPGREGTAMASEGEVFMFGPVPDGFAEAVTAAMTGSRPIHDVAFGGDGAWALVAGDWFATNGAPLELLGDLHRYRTDEDRRIDHVVLHPTERTQWALISNRAEPAPTMPADEMEREMGPDDASIWARMKANDIRGLAIAVVEGNQIAWARGYGSRGPGLSGDGTPDLERYVYPTTIFDAASISKPVAAVGALQLVDDGRLSLTRGGVLQGLIGTVVPSLYASAINILDPPGEVNLARLLSHCAGVDHAHGGSGAQERDPDKTEPPIQKVILGLPPAGSRYRAVRTFTPGDSTHYSGANYALVQGLIEAHASGGFDRHMRALFDDLEMFDSSFRPPEDRAERYAYGRSDDCGAASTCPVYAYPNKAAAGLTTTAMDLARFVIMLNQSGRYGSRRALREETVARMLKLDAPVGETLAERQCDDLGNMGLGMRMSNRGSSNERFWHRGTHNGFRTYIYGYPQRGIGLIVLMTADPDDANDFRDELWSRFLAVYL